MSEAAETAVSRFVEAARLFEDLVDRINDKTDWTMPALGVWDLRALVGHTSRALITVIEYSVQPAESESIRSTADYFIGATQHATNAEAVAERGRQAGHALGTDPAARVSALVAQAIEVAVATESSQLITVLGGGMQLREYLPTRTFELVVHSLDISAATGVNLSVPGPLMASVLEVATQIAAQRGDGPRVVASLTGRASLPPGYSVLG